MNAFAVRTTVVRRGYTQEAVSILSVVEGVWIVRITFRQAAIEDLTSHQIVFDITLTEAPGKCAVIGLLEAHHEPGRPGIRRVIDDAVEKIPAQITRSINNADLRVESPLQSTAGRIIPSESSTVRRNRRKLIVDEIEAILKLRIYLDNFSLKHGAFLCRHAIGQCENGRCIELIAFREFFSFPIE